MGIRGRSAIGSGGARLAARGSRQHRLRRWPSSGRAGRSPLPLAEPHPRFTRHSARAATWPTAWPTRETSGRVITSPCAPATSPNIGPLGSSGRVDRRSRAHRPLGTRHRDADRAVRCRKRRLRRSPPSRTDDRPRPETNGALASARRNARATLDVEAGHMGLPLEEDLNRRGFTLGHFPSSILCSTVGGWVAARSAGQCSGKYGKIEDMVLALECVTGTGDVVHTSTPHERTKPPSTRHRERRNARHRHERDAAASPAPERASFRGVLLSDHGARLGSDA